MLMTNNTLVQSYEAYTKAMKSIARQQGCTPKEYGQYVAGKRNKSKRAPKTMKKGMRK